MHKFEDLMKWKTFQCTREIALFCESMKFLINFFNMEIWLTSLEFHKYFLACEYISDIWKNMYLEPQYNIRATVKGGLRLLSP